MRLFNILKSVLQKPRNDNYSNVVNVDDEQELHKCFVKAKLTKDEFEILAEYYYKGITSYTGIFEYVYNNRIAKIMRVIRDTKQKARMGCVIEDTFIHFYSDSKHFIEIPVEIFANKRNLPINIRNTKEWNKRNILRILKLYPEYIKFENDLLKETISVGN